MTDRDFLLEAREQKADDLAERIRALHKDLKRGMPVYQFALQLRRCTWDHLANSLRKSKVDCSDETRNRTLQKLAGLGEGVG